MTKKYQIFISSTFRDLVDERQDVMRFVLGLGHIPSGMEMFPAAGVEQFEYAKKAIDDCDYYIVIVGKRYGTVDQAGVSFTEKEYRYAAKRKKTILAFICGDQKKHPKRDVERRQKSTGSLDRFRQIVREGGLVRYWLSRDDLKSEISTSLPRVITEYPSCGWVRGTSLEPGGSPEEKFEEFRTLSSTSYVRVDDASGETGILQRELVLKAKCEASIRTRLKVSSSGSISGWKVDKGSLKYASYTGGIYYADITLDRTYKKGEIVTLTFETTMLRTFLEEKESVYRYLRDGNEKVTLMADLPRTRLPKSTYVTCDRRKVPCRVSSFELEDGHIRFQCQPPRRHRTKVCELEWEWELPSGPSLKETSLQRELTARPRVVGPWPRKPEKPPGRRKARAGRRVASP